MTGDPAVIVNSWTGNVEVYAVSGGQLVQKMLLTGSGQWGAWTTV